MAASWLRVDKLEFGYGTVPVLAQLSLEFDHTHPVAGIVGRSGVGKSTLLNLIAGFEKPWAGDVWVHGERVEGPSARRPVVFQDHNLFPWKTVAQNIEIGLKARGVSRAARRERVLRIVEEFDLCGNEQKYPHELSGGMQQRVGLARALVVEPDCLIMDEPFGSLDEHTKLSVRDYFAGVVASRGMNAVHVTHDIDEAVRICSRIVLIKSATEVSVFDREGSTDADRRLLGERILLELSR